MFKNASALSEKEQQLLYVFKGVLTPAMILGGVFLGLLLFIRTDNHTVLPLLAVGFVYWVDKHVFGQSAFRFDGTARVVHGWRTNFRKKAVFEIPFSDIQGLRVETSFGGEMRSHRIALITAAGPTPLTLSYKSGGVVAEDARRIQAWLKTQGVVVPLVEETACRWPNRSNPKPPFGTILNIWNTLKFDSFFTLPTMENRILDFSGRGILCRNRIPSGPWRISWAAPAKLARRA